jgi:hypothetical protein
MDARTRRRVETEADSSAAGALLLANMAPGAGGSMQGFEDPKLKAHKIAELLKQKGTR